MKITLLDGPMGTQLIEMGHACPAPAWSAQPLLHVPEAIQQVHQSYASAGAQIHCANTFRTQAHIVGADWVRLTELAVQLAKDACQPNGRVAGCMAPIQDCYRPDLSPENPGPMHAQLAQALQKSGVDILLCETFPHIPEALSAVEAAVETGIETWVSFTAGPNGDLLQPDDIAKGAKAAISMGAGAVLVNCVPATQTARFLEPLQDLGVPFGAYANAGDPNEGLGWGPNEDGPKRYADHAERWIEMGATLIGSCCGTGPAHIQALHQRYCVPK